MPCRTSPSAALHGRGQIGSCRLAARRAREVEQAREGSLHLERRPGDEPQAILVVGSGSRVFEQKIHEPEHAEERVGHVVGDICGQVAERGRACEGQELAFDGRPAVVGEG